MLFAPGALTSIVPEWLPAGIPAGFTETLMVPGVVPPVGLTVSQGLPPEYEALYESGAPALVIISFLADGMWFPV